MPQPGPLTLPQVYTRRGPTSPPPARPQAGASGKVVDEGLACGSPGLKQLHPFLQLPDVRLQVSVTGLGFAELAAGEVRTVSPSGFQLERLLKVVTVPDSRPRPGEVLVGRSDGLQLLAQALSGKHLLLQGLLEFPQRHLGLCHRLRNGLRNGLWNCRFSLGMGTRLRAACGSWSIRDLGIGSRPGILL